MKRLHIRGERPTVTGQGKPIPVDWQIHNAHRPLLASWWNGNCLTWSDAAYPINGMHFAAVDNTDLITIGYNERQDAVELIFHSRIEIEAWVFDHLRAYGAAEVDMPTTDSEFDHYFFAHHGGPV